MTKNDGLEGWRARRKKEKSEDIYAAAIRCFESTGFYGTSVVDIAEAANVSTATIYNHFKSKEDLFAACIDRVRTDGRCSSAASDFLGLITSKDLAAIRVPQECVTARSTISKYVEAGRHLNIENSGRDLA